MRGHGYGDAPGLGCDGEEVVQRVRAGDGIGGGAEDDAARGGSLIGWRLDERLLEVSKRVVAGRHGGKDGVWKDFVKMHSN